MTKEEQGQFMRRKAAEKAAEMRRLEVRLQWCVRHIPFLLSRLQSWVPALQVLHVGDSGPFTYLKHVLETKAAAYLRS